MIKQKGFIDEGMLKFFLWVSVIACASVGYILFRCLEYIITHTHFSF